MFELCGLKGLTKILWIRDCVNVDKIRRATSQGLCFATARNQTAILKMRADRRKGTFTLVSAINVLARAPLCVFCFLREGLKLLDSGLRLRLNESVEGTILQRVLRMATRLDQDCLGLARRFLLRLLGFRSFANVLTRHFAGLTKDLVRMFLRFLAQASINSVRIHRVIRALSGLALKCFSAIRNDLIGVRLLRNCLLQCRTVEIAIGFTSFVRYARTYFFRFKLRCDLIACCPRCLIGCIILSVGNEASW